MKLNVNVGWRLFSVALALVAIYFLFTMTANPGVALAFALPIAKAKADPDGDNDEEEEADEEVKALLGKVRKAARKEVLEHVKAFNSEGETKINTIVDKKMEIFKDVPIDKLKKAVEDYEAANEAIASLKAKQQSTDGQKKENMFQTRLKEVYPDMIKRLKAGEKSFSFRIEEQKAAGDQIDSTAFGDRVIFGFREAGVTFAQIPELFILDLIQVMAGGPGSNPLSWIERNVDTQTGPPAIVANPTRVAESAVKPQLGYTWVENKISAETISAWVPVTKQAIFNYTMLDQEVRFELVRRLAQVLQSQIINGTGSSELKGINAYAQAFAAGSFANTIANANEYDVLVVAATQILLNNYIPTHALISHIAKGRLNLSKGGDGHYVLPPFATVGGLEVYGMKVIGTNEMSGSSGEQFLVIDPTKSLFNWVENITVELGWFDQQFLKNQWTIRGELQGMHRIKEHEKLAFVKGDFVTAKAAITV